MKSRKNLITLLAVAAIFLIVLGYLVFANFSKLAPQKNIQSFADCVAAGYPVMESYPRQCRTPDGRNFVEQIQLPPAEIITGVKSFLYDGQKFGFGLWYPENSKIQEKSFEGYLSVTKNPIVAVLLDQNLFKGTNLGEAVVVVGIGNDVVALGKCDQVNKDNDEQDLGAATINGISFHKFSATGVGAGNLYESIIYRTMQYDSCYEIAEVLHSGNIYNYTPGTVVEFDKAKFSAILEKIAATFAFTSQSQSGVFGSVNISPTCPVQRIPADPNCEPKPYQTTLIVTGANGFFKQVASDADGLFQIVLDPGSYQFSAQGGKILPRCESTWVEVKPNNFISLNISCDSGIR